MLCIPELPEDYDFEKTYEAVIAWCQKAFARIKQNTGNRIAARNQIRFFLQINDTYFIKLC